MKNTTSIFNIVSFLILFVTSTTRSQQPPSINNLNSTTSYTASEIYDVTGKIIAQSVSYFDELGKKLQTQSLDIKTNKVWANQTLYNRFGLPEVTSFSAPIGTSYGLDLNFIKKGQFFNSQPENLNTVSIQEATLGDYYKNTTVLETYKDVVNYPFSRAIYDPLNPGAVLKTIGGNQIDTDGDGIAESNPQPYSFSMPAAQELYYAFGRDYFKENDIELLELYGDNSVINELIANTSKKIITYGVSKEVVEDVHGVQIVVFQDDNGKVLATAKVGNGPQKQVTSLIGASGYVDIHLAKGCESSLDFLGDVNAYEVYNLKTSIKLSNLSTIPDGFYRIVAKQTGNTPPILSIDKNSGAIEPAFSASLGVTYAINYYDYSLNYYDRSGRLTASLQPLGFNNNSYTNYTLATPNASHFNNSLKSYYTYNVLGQLIETSSPDEGVAKFRYRKDGLIRYSQNSKQLKNGTFSYTNYDNVHRPVESGVITSTAFSTADVDGDLPEGTKKEVNTTVYDMLAEEDQNNFPAWDKKATFLAGNVAKTKNINSTTYYSYDFYGRVKWFLQKTDVGTRVIDYEYDAITGNVLKVNYQKNVNGTTTFTHRYTYDAIDNSLIKVETSANGGDYITHANYKYYTSGELKRVELAPNKQTGIPLQGIDYVYTASGLLKSINHPSLTKENDPGADDSDLFGMQIDYYKNDYQRSLPNINTPNYGIDLYNGNIKGVRWNNKELGNQEQTYSYYYNKENWLTDAIYGRYAKTGGVANLENSITDNEIYIAESKNLFAKQSITLLPGFHAKPDTEDVVDIKLVTNENTSFHKGDYNVYDITYDVNGNVQTLNRNKNTEQGINEMDKLGYYYNPLKPNQLQQVTDIVANTVNADDFKHQQRSKNYEYNEIGQLIRNLEEDLEYEYNASGLVTLIKHKGKPKVKFSYNERGHRVLKTRYEGEDEWYTDYVLDLQGNTIAVYNTSDLIEMPIYGAGRIGVYKANNTSIYQLTDHLGNVRAAIASDNNGHAIAKVATDYYPFGMPMPNRKLVNGEPYRYAYQGQEKDPETGKEAFQLRLWDARIGRWLTTDPYRQFDSPYLGMGNNPVGSVDPDGGFAFTVLGGLIGGVTAAINGDNVWAGIGTGALAGGLVDLTIATGGGALAIAGAAAVGGYADSALTDVFNGRKVNHERATIAGGFSFFGGAITKGASSLLARSFSRLVKPTLKITSTGGHFVGLGKSVAAKASTKALTKFYPSNNGFLGAAERQFLMPGQQLSRFGGNSGKFFSPAGTPLSMRALPPGANTSIHNTFKVLKPFEVQAGKIAPAFGKPGLGTQYLSPVSADVLLKRGIIGY